MPDSRQQLEGATSPQVFLLRTSTGDWLHPADSSFLLRRTKLLTPSVVTCRYSKSHKPQRPSRNLPEENTCVNENIFQARRGFQTRSRLWTMAFKASVICNFFCPCAATIPTLLNAKTLAGQARKFDACVQRCV